MAQKSSPESAKAPKTSAGAVNPASPRLTVDWAGDRAALDLRWTFTADKPERIQPPGKSVMFQCPTRAHGAPENGSISPRRRHRHGGLPRASVSGIGHRAGLRHHQRQLGNINMHWQIAARGPETEHRRHRRLFVRTTPVTFKRS